MATNWTTSEIAEAIGVTRSRVWQIAAELGVRPDKMAGTCGLWTDAQARSLIGHARPSWTAEARNKALRCER